MENNISFTGIKNIASINFMKEANQHRIISMVLTDDINGKDLEKFKSIASNSAYCRSGFRHPFGSDILNIECIKRPNEDNTIYLNGQVLDVKKENMSMFTFLAKLMLRISKIKDKDLIVNKDYKEFAADDILIFGNKLSEAPAVYRAPDGSAKITSMKEFMDYFFVGDQVRSGAKGIDEFICEIMNKYLGIR